jgi:hypothetical protein
MAAGRFPLRHDHIGYGFADGGQKKDPAEAGSWKFGRGCLKGEFLIGRRRRIDKARFTEIPKWGYLDYTYNPYGELCQ